jgi:hypothetical protein
MSQSNVDRQHNSNEWKFSSQWTIAVVASASSSGRKSWTRIGNATDVSCRMAPDKKTAMVIVRTSQQQQPHELNPFLLQPMALDKKYATALEPAMLSKDGSAIASKFCCIYVCILVVCVHNVCC